MASRSITPGLKKARDRQKASQKLKEELKKSDPEFKRQTERFERVFGGGSGGLGGGSGKSEGAGSKDFTPTPKTSQPSTETLKPKPTLQSTSPEDIRRSRIRNLESEGFGGSTLATGDLLFTRGFDEPVREPTRRERLLRGDEPVKFSDIAFNAPPRRKEGREFREREGKVSGGEFAELKTIQSLRKVSDLVSPLVPEGVIKRTLETKVPIRFTDIAKFALFEPLLASSFTAEAKAIQQAGISDTKFVADVIKKGKVSDVKVVSDTKIGGFQTSTISNQTLKEIDDAVSVGQGTSISGRKVGGGQGDREFTFGRFGGVGEKLGKAKQVKVSDLLSVERDIGTGVRGRGGSVDIATIKGRRGLRVGVPEFTAEIPKIDIKQSDLIGVISPGEKGISRFIGTTEKPTRSGFSNRIPIQDINVRGLIRTSVKGESDDIGGLIIRGTKRKKTSTASLDKAIEKSIATQAGIAQKASRVALSKEIAKITSIPKIPIIPTTRTKTTRTPRTKQQQTISQGRFDIDLSNSKLPDLSTGRFSDLGVQSSRFNLGLGLSSGLSSSTKQRSRQQSKSKSRLREEEALGLIPKQDLRLRQSSRQGLRLRQSLKQRGRSRSFFPIPNITIPKSPPILPFAFAFKKPKVKRNKKITPRNSRSRSLSESFSQRQLLQDLPKELIRLRRRGKSKRFDI